MDDVGAQALQGPEGRRAEGLHLGDPEAPGRTATEAGPSLYRHAVAAALGPFGRLGTLGGAPRRPVTMVMSCPCPLR